MIKIQVEGVNYELYEDTAQIVENMFIVESVRFLSPIEIKATGRLEHIDTMIKLLRNLGVYVGKTDMHYWFLTKLKEAGCPILSINDTTIKFYGFEIFKGTANIQRIWP